MFAMEIFKEIGSRHAGVHIGIYEVDLGRDSATSQLARSATRFGIGVRRHREEHAVFPKPTAQGREQLRERSVIPAGNDRQQFKDAHVLAVASLGWKHDRLLGIHDQTSGSAKRERPPHE